MKGPSEEALNTLEKNLLNHENMFQKNKVRHENRLNTKFVFKVGLEHSMIPKFIGKSGSRIRELEDTIRACDNGFDGERLRINISEDKKIRMKFLHFEVLTTNAEVDEKVLITIEMNTDNREESLSTVKDLVIKAIENVSGYSYSNNYQNSETEGYDDDISGW